MTFDYAALEAVGFTKVKVGYSGHNDEGWINDITAELGVGLPEVVPHDDLYQRIEGAAYDLLERRYPGWEINEGSEGTITIHVAERRADLHHGTNYESTKWEDTSV